jgi:hypothetical protein
MTAPASGNGGLSMKNSSRCEMRRDIGVAPTFRSRLRCLHLGKAYVRRRTLSSDGGPSGLAGPRVTSLRSAGTSRDRDKALTFSRKRALDANLT